MFDKYLMKIKIFEEKNTTLSEKILPQEDQQVQEEFFGGCSKPWTS